MCLLVALLCNIVVTERYSCLGQLIEELRLLELLGGLKGHLNVATLQGEVVPLLCVLFKEKSDLTVALLLKVADDRATAELTSAKNLPDLGQILLLQSSLKQVVCIVNFVDFHLSHTIERVECVTHELYRS